MSRQVAIRLGTEGKAQVVADLDSIGKTGDAALNRVARAAVRAGQDADEAIARANRQATKLAALLPGLNPGKLDSLAGVQEGTRKSAEQSAAVFGAAYAEMERRAEALRMSLDPAYAAQQRFNREIGNARTLIAAGAITLDEYVGVLRREQAALDAVSGQHGRIANSSGAMRQAMAGASYQVQDFVTQISMGANPITAFVVQGGQLAGQFMNVEGKAGAVARFLMGPWGLAIQIGLMALGPLVAKLWESSKASDEAKKATEAHRKAILDLADAERKALDSAQRRQAVTVATIKTQYDAAIATREEARALLAKARAEEQMNNSAGAVAIGGEGISEVQRQSRERVRALEAEMAKASADVVRLRSGGEAAFARLVGMKVDARSTPEGLVQSRFEQARMDAMKSLAGDPERLAGRLRELNTIREAEVERIQKLEAAERKLGETRRDSETLSATAVAKMLRGALPGVQVTSTTGGKHVANSYHYRPGGQAVDFVPAGGMSSMTKADVRRIFESRGIQIVELLGPGDKGHSDHFHVAWTKGKLALDEFTDSAKRAQDETKALNDIISDARGVDIAAIFSEKDQKYRAAVRDLVGDGDPLKVASGQDLKAMDDADREFDRERLRRGKDSVQQLATFYQSVFTNGTGSIWDMFRQRGLQAIGDLLAKWTLGQNGAGGLMGALGSLFGGKSDAKLGAEIASSANAALAGLPKLASGTEYWSGGAALVGEHGPEVASLPRGTRVTPAGATRRMMAGNDNGWGGAPQINVYAEGAVLAETVRGWVAQGMQAAAQQGAVGGARLGAADNARKSRRRIRG